MTWSISPDVPPQEGDLPIEFPTLVSETVLLGATLSAQVVDTFPSGVFRATKYLITVSQGDTCQVDEIMLLQDGTNTYLQVYGEAYNTSEPIATFDAAHAGSVTELSVTLVLAQAGQVQIQAIRIAV